MQVLVTVGTTKFPELVTAAVDPEVATLLLSMGYQHMEVQVCGTGNLTSGKSKQDTHLWK